MSWGESTRGPSTGSPARRLASGDHVVPGFRAQRPDNPVLFFHELLADHAAGARGQHGARHDARALPHLELTARSAARGDDLHDSKRGRNVIRPERKSIHCRLGERRRIDGRTHLVRQRPPKRLVQGHRFERRAGLYPRDDFQSLFELDHQTSPSVQPDGGCLEGYHVFATGFHGKLLRGGRSDDCLDGDPAVHGDAHEAPVWLHLGEPAPQLVAGA